MSNESRTLVHEWFERVWNQQQREAIDELMAADACVHGLKGADGCDVAGTSAFHGMHEVFCEAFPDIKVEVEECLVDGDRIAFRCTVRGTHRGASLGVAPSGREVEFAGMGFVRVRDGQIVEAWNTFDFLAMNAQIAP